MNSAKRYCRLRAIRVSMTSLYIPVAVLRADSRSSTVEKGTLMPTALRNFVRLSSLGSKGAGFAGPDLGLGLEDVALKVEPPRRGVWSVAMFN